MAIIISCVRGLESFEEGAKSPAAQTVRDRLILDGNWYEYFHEAAWLVAKWAHSYYRRLQWYISIDETYVPFFGKRKRLNASLMKNGLGKQIHGYRAKTKGATGSFCFLVVSLCCCRIRIPVAIKMVAVKETYQPWLEPVLEKLLKLTPKAIILADRGFGKATWFYMMLERLDAQHVIRIPVRKKENKNKIKRGAKQFQYWMTDSKTNEKVLLTVAVVKDEQQKKYYFAHNLNKTGTNLLRHYKNRWDLENIFKDCDRVELPTSSRNPRMRLFSVVVSFFLFMLWQAESALNKTKFSLRTFVKTILEKICLLIQCIITPLGRLIPAPH